MSSRSNNNYIYSGSMPALEMMLQKLLFLCGNLGKINGWYSTTIHPTHAYFTNYYQADPECVMEKISHYSLLVLFIMALSYDGCVKYLLQLHPGWFLWKIPS